MHAGFTVHVLEFPPELDSEDGSHHDGVFVRDVGFMFEEYWIKSNFNATNRQIEAEVYSQVISERFGKEIIHLPEEAFIEFGEVYYLETTKGSFYFGGLSRANKKGHEFVKQIVQPDHYCLIKSKGYHLDTVLTPVVNKENLLIAIIVAKEMLEEKSFACLQELGIELIVVDKKDSVDEDGLGTYAVNCLVNKGVLVSGAHFSTARVEERLRELEIDFHVVPLKDFNFSGGSVHCLVNEIH